MRAFRSLSDWYRQRSRRERRIIAAGAIVSAVAVATVFLILPFVDRWSAREEAIEAKRDQLTRLTDLLRRQEPIRVSLRDRRATRASFGNRLLTGETMAVAASALQELMQQYARDSDVELSRFDVDPSRTPEDDGARRTDAGQQPDDSQGAAPATILARMSGEGDVFGLIALVHRLENGDKLLILDDLRVYTREETEDGPQLLTISLSLRAPVVTK